ncbi:HTH iclR-type domain-containing protein [Frankia sp. AiPs1]
MAGNNGEAGRTVSSRVFAVLDAFAGPAQRLRLTDIAEWSGLPMPTALRLVRELVEWGGLERFTDGTYRIGRRLWALGTTAPCVRRMGAATRPSLEQLAARTGADVYLAVLDGADVVVTEHVGGGHPHGGRGGHPRGGHPHGGYAPGACGAVPRVRVGDRLPLHACAAGKALLAHVDPHIDDLMAHGVALTRFTPPHARDCSAAGRGPGAGPGPGRGRRARGTPARRRRDGRRDLAGGAGRLPGRHRGGSLVGDPAGPVARCRDRGGTAGSRRPARPVRAARRRRAVRNRPSRTRILYRVRILWVIVAAGKGAGACGCWLSRTMFGLPRFSMRACGPRASTSTSSMTVSTGTGRPGRAPTTSSCWTFFCRR